MHYTNDLTRCMIVLHLPKLFVKYIQKYYNEFPESFVQVYDMLTFKLVL